MGNISVVITAPGDIYPDGVSVQIESHYFCCAVVIKNNVVIEAAPIIKYMKGWTAAVVEKYCDKKGWKITVIAPGIKEANV